MNYYNPNYYQNYTNQYQAQNPTMPQALNGKMVDTIDMVRIAEVPLGSYGVFPKGDFSEVYIKYWNPNGTTNILTFKQADIPEPIPEQSQPNMDINAVLDRITVLENKVNSITNNSKSQKKEMSANDY